MRKVGNVQEKIALLLVQPLARCRSTGELVADLSHLGLQLVVGSLRHRRAPISLLSRLRSDCSRCKSVSLLRRSASIRNTSSIFASSPPLRVARRSRTKSGFSRIRRMSSMVAIVGAAVVGGKCDWVAHASGMLVSASRRNELLLKVSSSKSLSALSESSRSRGRARRHA